MLLSKVTHNKYICHRKETTSYHHRQSKKDKIETTVKIETIIKETLFKSYSLVQDYALMRC